MPVARRAFANRNAFHLLSDAHAEKRRLGIAISVTAALWGINAAKADLYKFAARFGRDSECIAILDVDNLADQF
jgi:hypothetical protein